MASSDPTNTTNGRARAVRRKASEACERCREKRIKCNGFQPCEQCIKKDVQCVFAFAPSAQACGTEAIVEKLDHILSRLDRIEEEQSRQAHVLASYSGPNAKQPPYPRQRRSSGVAQLNQQTGCFEYYGQFSTKPSNVILVISSVPGQTSTFTIASCLGKRLRQLEDVPDDDSSIRPTTRRRNNSDPEHQTSRDKSSKGLVLDELPGFCDYVVPLNALRSDRYLLEKVADRHTNSFFKTIHFLLPILSPVAFETRYKALRQLFGDRRLSLATLDDPTRPQFVCLMYAVLALGALYEDEQEDSSSWASWYFAEAQDMLGRLLNASNLELVQASTLLGAYAQHAIKPNLAYILNGLATRLAFSNGLNIESLHSSLGIDNQEAKRTWWIIYIQEVELSLDSGRPMCLGSLEMNINYPKSQVSAAEADIATSMLTFESSHPVSAESAEQSNFKLEQTEELLSELHRWRASLPQYLTFEDENQDAVQHVSDKDAPNSLYTWESRQQSSLRIHYYLAIIILLQGSIPRNPSERHASSSRPLSQRHQSSYLNAARNMIRHIHELLALAPHLRRWTYYCFYCLQATLVILLKVADDQHCSRRRQRRMSNDSRALGQVDHETVEDDRKLCNLAVEVFDLIRLKASQRCADVVRHFLDKWRPERTTNDPDARRTSSRGLDDCGMQQVPSPTGDFPLPVEYPVPLNNENESSESVESVDWSDSTSPHVSLSGLQAELHDAFYSNLNDGLNFAQQPSFIGVEGFGAFPLELGTTGTADGCWPLYDQ
ncbi:hypothetical protein FOXB_16564 [Fusarium oxysporum f. sp. conglutinans Fo5176]|uniref:Zn(2)-C6 fungal-type domain-containing protein n=1 Tax=Fusarium oxysporum (strain Fo5176) TaxID=660025 RepID=F9GD30_FUSOF|nr:hypothetical protein FOXB_16564 [Fusarium oxysporum f. sp. conglutinans Fo5176]